MNKLSRPKKKITQISNYHKTISLTNENMIVGAELINAGKRNENFDDDDVDELLCKPAKIITSK